MTNVIFACTHNAGRSQMAAAFFNALCDPSQARATSAGTAPSAQLHPEVVEAMREIGIDLSKAQPQLLTPEIAEGTNVLITMGCSEACPTVPGARTEDWPIPDPKGLPLDEVRAIRDETCARVLRFLDELGVGAAR